MRQGQTNSKVIVIFSARLRLILTLQSKFIFDCFQILLQSLKGNQ